MAQSHQLRDQRSRQILVQLELHGRRGTSGVGISSAADAAANAMAARTSSIVSVGKSASISSTAAPSARLERTLLSVTLVPRSTGSPPQMAGSRTIRFGYAK